MINNKNCKIKDLTGMKNVDIKEKILMSKDKLENRSEKCEYTYADCKEYLFENSKVRIFDKNKCDVCGISNYKETMKDADKKEDISNEGLQHHHLLKIEHIAALFQKYELLEKKNQQKDDKENEELEENIEEKENEELEENIEEKENENVFLWGNTKDNKNNKGKKDKTEDKKYQQYRGSKNKYRYAKGVEPYYPGSIVCKDDHRIFHELLGDYKLNKAWDMDLNKANHIWRILENKCIRFKEKMKVRKSDCMDVKGYKTEASEIWYKSVETTLLRLGVVMKINEFIDNGRIYDKNLIIEANDYDNVIYTCDDKNKAEELEQVNTKTQEAKTEIAMSCIENTIIWTREELGKIDITYPEFEKFNEEEIEEMLHMIEQVVEERRNMPGNEDLDKFEEEAQKGTYSTNRELAVEIFEKFINFNQREQEEENNKEITTSDLEALSDEELEQVLSDLESLEDQTAEESDFQVEGNM